MAVIQYRRYVEHSLEPTEQPKAFRIDIARQEKTFFPGETIEGKILFVWIHRYQDLLGIMVRLKCTGEIHLGKRTVDAFFQHTYYLKRYYVCGDGVHDIPVPSSPRLYPFVFTLPSTGLPQSFSGTNGSIKYVIEAVARLKENPSTVTTVEEIKVRGYLDLNVSVPKEILAGPITLEFDNAFVFPGFELFRKFKYEQPCSKGKGDIQVTVVLSKRGFSLGEIIQCRVKVTNESRKELPRNLLTFLQIVRYKAQNLTKIETNVLGTSEGPIIKTKSCGRWDGTFEVPFDLPVSSSSNVSSCIKISYKLKVEIVTGPISRNVKYDYPILIGTIPFENISRRSRSMEFRHAEETQPATPSEEPLLSVQSARRFLSTQPSIECPNYLDLASSRTPGLCPTTYVPPPTYEEAMKNYDLN